MVEKKSLDNLIEKYTLKSLMTNINDENMYQIAEIGIGLNPNGSIRGVIIEDESTLGTVHIGLGNNILWGGEIEQNHILIWFLKRLKFISTVICL